MTLNENMDNSTESTEGVNELGQPLLNQMIDVISSITATPVFKSQQIDDPELTHVEKKKIAEQLLINNPSVFLTRFGHLLTDEHLKLMATLRVNGNSCNHDFYMAQLKQLSIENSKKKIIKNRRFEAMKRLEEGGEYFSEIEMQGREPLLYHQLVGQFLSEKEKSSRYKEANKTQIPSFSNFLMTHAEETAMEDRLRCQIEAEDMDGISSDEEPRPGSSKERPRTTWGADWEDEEKENKRKDNRWKKKVKESRTPTEAERQLLLEEFKTHLHTKFLAGLDADFDYSSVDENPEYDCLQVRSQDEEERYFDDETCDNITCTDTGIEDY